MTKHPHSLLSRNIVMGLIGLMLYLFSLSAWASTDPPQDIPLPLQPWINWVLPESQDYTCPFEYNKTTQHCRWPSRLTLNVSATQAKFSQQWQIYSEGWLALPGNAKHWPQAVQLNDKPAIVTDRRGVPSIFAPQGLLTIQGTFQFSRRPEFVQMPQQTGLLDLTIDDIAVAMPQIDNQGRLWLTRQTDDQAAEENRLDIHVYRRINDDIPLQVITRIELDVAGRHREIVLGPVMLNRHIAMSLDSPLPARLESDGSLRLQVRPGSWVLTLRTRQEGATYQLTLTPSEGQWVDEEIWVFKAHHDLRIVEIGGVTAIDPQQTALPSTWRQYPAYQVRAGDTLELIEKRRGDPEPAPDRLQLERHFWLDFDGQGYSVQDHITGSMTRGWRLEMAEPGLLGRVAVNGQDQFITRLEEGGNTGVEMRRGQIDLVADSRLETAVSELPAVGWAHDFQNVKATLHLPPGWGLLNATGVDDVPRTWLKRWTLLDLFIVLIMAAAIGKLWHWAWGALTLITMVLISHETNAPYWVWLNIIAAIGLLRVLPEIGWFSRIVRSYRNLSLLVLLIIALPFMMQQARQSLYPQLEYPWKKLDRPVQTTYTAPSSAEAYGEMDRQAVQKSMPSFKMPQESRIMDSLPQQQAYKDADSFSVKKSQKKLLQIDPNAQVQTGPGLPQWEWRAITMHWSGPVQHNQTIDLWLFSPIMNSVLGFMRVILLAILIVFFLWASWGSGARRLFKKAYFQLFKKPITPAATTTLLLIGLLLCWPVINHAETPVSQQPEQTEPVFERIKDSMKNVSDLIKDSIVEIPLTKQEISQFIFKQAIPFATGQTQVTVNEFPPQSLLEELKTRLLAQPDCLPYCASSPRLFLELEAKQLSGRMAIHSQTDTAVPLPGLAKQWLPQQVQLDGEPAQGLLRNSKGQLWISLTKGIHEIHFTGRLPNRNTVLLPLPLKPHQVEIKVKGWRVEGVHENGIADAQLQFTREQLDDSQQAELEMGSLPPFVQIERTLLLGLDWQIETRVIRKTPQGTAIVLEIPLLKGESVTSEQIRVKEGKALINLSPNASGISWTSVFDKQETISLTAQNNISSSEVWRLDASAIWHVEIEGIPVVHHQDKGRWLPEWRPWPGETVTININRPGGVTGQVLTIDRSQLIVSPGQRTTDNVLRLNLRSSRGMQHQLTLPKEALLQSVEINGKSQPIRQDGQFVTLPITPGTQQVELRFQQPIGISQYFSTPNIGIGIDNVNTLIEINMPRERWILFTGGDPIGPAVMIWGILIVIVLVSVGLGQISLTPLNTLHWLLLGIVLSQVKVELMLVVIAWFILLGWRARISPDLPALKFNAIQFGLLILTGIALTTLLFAIKQGLLGHPNMHIAGNGSSAYYLRWYEDRTSGIIPQVWVFSWSMWIYRIAMLLWALWLSFALLRWLRWGWECFSTHQLWKPWRSSTTD